MGHVVHPSQLMCHGMYIAKTCWIESHASQKLSISHHVSSLHVFPILHCRGQVAADQLYGVQATGVRHRIAGCTHIRFDGMSQCIHASSCRQTWWLQKNRTKNMKVQCQMFQKSSQLCSWKNWNSNHSETLRHANHRPWIIHRQGGRDSPIHNGHLHMPRLVRDDAEAGHLSASSCGGVHGHHGHHGFGALIHTFHLSNVPTIGGRQSNGLGAV